MKRQSERKWTSRLSQLGVGRMAAGVALVGAGMLTGAALTSTGPARAEVQPAGEPQHFQSGDQLSLPILKEIAATLKQMDARLARIETAAQQFRPARVSPAPIK